MQKLFAILSVAFSVALFSCNDKDPDPQPEPNPEPTDTTAQNATLLTKTVLTSGADVTTKTYQYDANKKLVWYSNTSTKADYFEDTSKIVRDASGIITQIIYRSDTSRKFNDPKVDSIVYNLVYDAAASKYTYKLAQYKMYTTQFKDSAAYTYDAQSRITQENSYYFDYKKTKEYVKWATNDFTYNSNGDLTNLKTTYYNIDGNNTDYPFEFVYTYEDKGVSLLNLGNEAILIGITQNHSGRVPKTLVATYPQNPEFNHNYSYVYTYNKKYYPLKADVTDAAMGNAKSTLTFMYQ